MRRTEPIQPNAEDLKIVRQSSWLCRVFQEENVKPEEKVQILKTITSDHKKRRAVPFASLQK